MKKYFVTFGLALSVTLIVLSLLVPVNHSVALPGHTGAMLVADGTPIPPVPPPPPPPQQNIVIADGTPIPPVPPPPPPPNQNLLLTDNCKTAVA